MRKLFSNDGVQSGHGGSTVIASPYSTEFKLISCKSKWRRTVTISSVENDLRNLVNAEFHVHVITLLDLHISFLLKFVEYGGHL
jgi:hypothetical protein